MERLRPYPVFALCAVTLVIWTTRLPLAWTNDEDSVAEKVVWTLPITAFWVAAAVLGVLLVTGRMATVSWAAGLARAFAIGTIAYWVIRAPMIMVADVPASVDNAAGFKAIHAVLAVVSIAVAALALRALRSGAGPVGSDATPVAA